MFVQNIGLLRFNGPSLDW